MKTIKGGPKKLGAIVLQVMKFKPMRQTLAQLREKVRNFMKNKFSKLFFNRCGLNTLEMRTNNSKSGNLHLTQNFVNLGKSL